MTIKINFRAIWFVLCVVIGFGLASCSEYGKNDTESKQREAVNSESTAAATGFTRLIKSQQIPVFDYSQERQTLIDVLGVRARGTHGTAIVTSMTGELLWWCPTQGAPVPSTYQLTPSQQYVDIPSDETKSKLPVDQGEQTGVYTGESAATWVICLDDAGTPFGQYDEANVRWTAGIVSGLPADKRARVDEITYDFTLAEDNGG